MHNVYIHSENPEILKILIPTKEEQKHTKMKTTANLNTEIKQFYGMNVPEGWEVNNFGRTFNFLKAYSFSRNQFTYQKSKGEILNIHYGDIHSTFKGKLLDISSESNIPFIKNGQVTENEIKIINYLKDGDLVIADASEDYEGICKSIELVNVKDSKILGGLHTFVVRSNFKDIALGYRAYVLSHQAVVKRLRQIATGTSVYGVSKTNLSKIKLLLPPVPEQKAIATVLSTMDNLIQKTKQLITQKEKRKKWLMQVLLTGKKRLDGFSGEWKEYIFEYLFKFKRTFAFSRAKLEIKPNKANNVFNIHYGDIHAKFKKVYIDFISDNIPSIIESSADKFKDDFLISGDIVMADASEDISGIGESKEIANLNSQRAIGGLHTFVIRDIKGLTAPRFRGYLFNMSNIRNQLRKIATGISVYGISKGNLKRVKFFIPKISEQTAIVNILITADKEIALLRQKVEKIEEQKRGLMQVLLTGKVRLNCGKQDSQN